MTVVMKNIIGGMSQPTFCASTSGRKRTYLRVRVRVKVRVRVRVLRLDEREEEDVQEERDAQVASQAERVTRRLSDP